MASTSNSLRAKQMEEFSIIPVDTREFNFVFDKLSEFFKQRGFLADCKQHVPTIMAACEDPPNMLTYNFQGKIWPMIQTNQMHLEDELLGDRHLGTDKAYKGLYALTTSYRNEQHPIKGRHSRMFPMFEFESPGHFQDLIDIIKDLLLSFGYKSENFIEIDYADAAKKYGVCELEAEHEMQLYKDNGPRSVIFLKYFPEFTDPFWNMKRVKGTDKAYKLDVLLGGHETFGTAERSCCKKQMRHSFDTIVEGEYAGKLYREFGKDRVEVELEEYLEYDFFPRFGGGIGITRLINGLKVDGLLGI